MDKLKTALSRYYEGSFRKLMAYFSVKFLPISLHAAMPWLIIMKALHIILMHSHEIWTLCQQTLVSGPLTEWDLPDFVHYSNWFQGLSRICSEKAYYGLAKPKVIVLKGFIEQTYYIIKLRTLSQPIARFSHLHVMCCFIIFTLFSHLLLSTIFCVCLENTAVLFVH